MTDRDNREEALSLYSGPRRTYEIFCLVAESPQSMQQILDAVPGDEAVHPLYRSGNGRR